MRCRRHDQRPHGSSSLQKFRLFGRVGDGCDERGLDCAGGHTTTAKISGQRRHSRETLGDVPTARWESISSRCCRRPFWQREMSIQAPACAARLSSRLWQLRSSLASLLQSVPFLALACCVTRFGSSRRARIWRRIRQSPCLAQSFRCADWPRGPLLLPRSCLVPLPKSCLGSICATGPALLWRLAQRA